MSRHLIFDLDGTLVDSCAICVGILQSMLVDRNSAHAICPDEARSYMSRGGKEMVLALLGPGVIDPDADLVEFRRRYAEITTPVDTLFPGVAASLRRLHGHGLTLSICSNKPQILCDRVLQDTGIADLFSVVQGGRPDLRAKPAPDLLSATLVALNASAADCIYIGDSELDYAVARDAGMPFVFMSYGYAEGQIDDDNLLTFDCFSAMADALLDSALRDAA